MVGSRRHDLPMRTLLSLIAVLSLAGCASMPGRLRDTATIHDAAATRVWLVHETADGGAAVVLCDAEMLKQTHVLCARWPR